MTPTSQKHTPDGTVVPQSRRKEINEKILYVIDTGSNALPDSVIYNCYTGEGGLHGLEFKDFANYREFSNAKKEIEAGQFLTPPELCRKAVALSGVDRSERVLDACCGTGGFFNFLPDERNAWGFDIDGNALKVARRLYPEAHLRNLDVRLWTPEEEDKFDVIFQNAPFNLEFTVNRKTVLSQNYILLKSAGALKPGGLIAVICPESFLADPFWNRSDLEAVEGLYSFIGQCRLDPAAFKGVGVDSFRTKLMFWFRKTDTLTGRPYDGSFMPEDELEAAVAAYRKERHASRMKILRETLEGNTDREFRYRLNLLLYQIKVHPATRDHYGKALDYYEQYRTQKMPQGLSQEQQEDWMRNKRITPAKVLAYCRRILSAQNPRRRETGFRLVMDRSSIRLVCGSDDEGKRVKELEVKPLPVRMAVTSDTPVENHFPVEVRHLLKPYHRLIGRKRREYRLQDTPFRDITPSRGITDWLETFTFRNLGGAQCRLTALQKSDLGRLMSKRYSLINWQQGSGKTAALYAFGSNLLENGLTRCIFVVAPALAVNLTWKPFLKANGAPFTVLRTRTDIERVNPRGQFLVVSLSMIGTLEKPLQRLCRTLGQKAALLLDESDELTNPLSVRTRATLSAFRRLHHKMLATGTTTRNNIGEMYSQLELLYNNSVNFLCTSPKTYEYDRDGNLEEKPNPYFMQPFPPRGGHRLFRSCHCPGKATVFGIDKFNQDVLNADDLWDICEKTVITRQFTEFAGKKYSIFTHGIKPTPEELSVYNTVFNDLVSIIPQYFSPIADTRKESALRLVRLIELLIRSCSTPHTMPGYSGGALPTKTLEILRMLEERREEKVLIGVTSLETLELYRSVISERFPSRSLSVIDGSVEFRRREAILKAFEATSNGILVCTQQALKSSVNIPTCNEVIVESLQWNIPKIAQFFFRTIRFDSLQNTNVHFLIYEGSIEQNILRLLLAKQNLNDFIKEGEVGDEEQTRAEFGIQEGFLDTLIGKEHDDDGRVHFTWGGQRIS